MAWLIKPFSNVVKVKIMKIIDKIQWFVLPSLFFIGIGVLEIKFPNVINVIIPEYTIEGKGWGAFFYTSGIIFKDYLGKDRK